MCAMHSEMIHQKLFIGQGDIHMVKLIASVLLHQDICMNIYILRDSYHLF